MQPLSVDSAIVEIRSVPPNEACQDGALHIARIFQARESAIECEMQNWAAHLDLYRIEVVLAACCRTSPRRASSSQTV